VNVEVDHQGIFIHADSTTSTGGDSEIVRGRKGFLIESSDSLKITCSLPASVLIEVPQKKVPDVISMEDEGGEENGEGALDTIPSYQWVGEPSGDMHHSIMGFLASIAESGSPFRICFACADRMHRDVLALTGKTMAGFAKTVGVRERLVSLPWYSLDETGGFTKRVGAQSSAGSDLNRRLKELEEENSQLKRRQSELTIQLLEMETNMSPSYNTTISGTVTTSETVASQGVTTNTTESDAEDVSTVTANEEGENETEIAQKNQLLINQHQQQIASLKGKLRDLEREISLARNKEVSY
jgi:hypothetical protein